MNISVIAPMYNEAGVIGTFIERTIATLQAHYQHYELVLVDDGSLDDTVLECLPYIRQYPQIRLLTFSRHYGHEIASTAGFDYVSGDLVVLMDSDGQHPPELIPDMVEKFLQGYDIVCASRTNQQHPTLLKKITARWFYSFARKMTGFQLDPLEGNFRLLSKQVVSALKTMKEHNRHLLMMFEYIGFKKISIQYECENRLGGQSKYNLAKLTNLALDSIIGFSRRPLRVMSVCSLLVSGLMMIYAGFILIEKLFFHQKLAEGVASLIFLIAGLFSILFLFLAIISEYISRTLTESKNRPLYYIRQEITHDTLNLFD